MPKCILQGLVTHPQISDKVRNLCNDEGTSLFTPKCN